MISSADRITSRPSGAVKAGAQMPNWTTRWRDGTISGQLLDRPRTDEKKAAIQKGLRFSVSPAKDAIGRQTDWSN